MEAAIYNFKRHQSGSTFERVEFRLRVQQREKDLTGAAIVMTLEGTSYSYYVGHGITIDDAQKGIFSFDRQIIALPVGIYFHNITITFADGSVKKYIKGTWQII